MSHPKFNYAMDLLYTLGNHFGGVYVPIGNGCNYKQTDEIIDIIASTMCELDDFYESAHTAEEAQTCTS